MTPTVTVVVVSRDEPALDATLHCLRDCVRLHGAAEVVVVDASSGRLDAVCAVHPWVQWIPFARSRGKAVTIPEQRNVGVAAARGEVVVFTDAGCTMDEDWLVRLLEPFAGGEVCVLGGWEPAGQGPVLYQPSRRERGYVLEGPTMNFAITSDVLERVGGFDEAFEYSSDADLCWRLGDLGHRILFEPEPTVRHDFGDARRQMRRAYVYGAGRARLYAKHRSRRRRLLQDDPLLLVYPAFLLGLPLALLLPLYPVLLVIPLWRARGKHPWLTLLGHLLYGAGALTFLIKPGPDARA